MHMIAVLLYMYDRKMATGILKYCKPVRSLCPSYSPSLPEPNGLLSEKVPSKVIELANTEVARNSYMVEALI